MSNFPNRRLLLTLILIRYNYREVISSNGALLSGRESVSSSPQNFLNAILHLIITTKCCALRVLHLRNKKFLRVQNVSAKKCLSRLWVVSIWLLPCWNFRVLAYLASRIWQQHLAVESGSSIWLHGWGSKYICVVFAPSWVVGSLHDCNSIRSWLRDWTYQ